MAVQGDATTGWNFATTVDHRNLKQQLSSSLANSIKSTREQIVALKQYQTPAQHSAAVAEKVRAARSAAALQLAALEAKYGKDGAAELQRIANMHPVGIKRKHQVMSRLYLHVTALRMDDELENYCMTSSSRVCSSTIHTSPITLKCSEMQQSKVQCKSDSHTYTGRFAPFVSIQKVISCYKANSDCSRPFDLMVVHPSSPFTVAKCAGHKV